MKKMTWKEMRDLFFDHESKRPEEHLIGYVVFKESNWEKKYSETSRTYKISSNNKGFQPGKISNSIYADCMDGTDPGVRLYWYNWDVEYCYIEDQEAV